MTPCTRALAGLLACAFRALPLCLTPALGFLLAAGLFITPARAQTGEGTIVGQVFDSETGTPLQGVTVIVKWPAPEDGGKPAQEVQVTDAEGAFGFASVPSGSYSIDFVKSGYRASTMTDVSVEPGQLTRADFPLPPLPPETSDEVLELDAFVVEASTVEEMMPALELRIDSEALINTMSAADLSKYAAGDVAAALVRVAGVTVQKGQFAIIRGLEDRYNNAMYNSAPIPSPDPDRQSVQLDLFPSEIVSNLVVAKTFAPELPSNSSGGSIDIITHDYPTDLEIAVKAAVGVNANALDRFIEFVPGSPVGQEADPIDTIAREFGGLVGGRGVLAGREVRYKALVNWGVDFDTAVGFREKQEPSRPIIFFEGSPRERVVTSGSAAFGEMLLTGARFDQTVSEREEQLTGYGGVGFDLDPGGRHAIDASAFYTRKKQEVVDLRENGWLPGFDYSVPAQIWEDEGELPDPSQVFFQQGVTSGCVAGPDRCATLSSWLAKNQRGDPTRDPDRGALWFTSFLESKSFDIERNLLVAQINGSHEIETLEGLGFSWAANHARATQDEVAVGAQIFFEPDNAADPDYEIPTEFPVRPEDLGPGSFATRSSTGYSGILFSTNEIEEKQWFGRLDANYEAALSEELSVEVKSGGWYEHANRDVLSTFLQNPAVGGSQVWALLGETPLELGQSILPSLDLQEDGQPFVTREAINQSSREIWAWNLGVKGGLWQQLDLLGGIRLENIFIESINDPFTGEPRFTNPPAPATYPETYLLFERRDNPDRAETGTRAPPPGTIFNDQILGIGIPDELLTPCPTFRGGPLDRLCVDLVDEEQIQTLINGTIDQRKLLPSAGFAWRPLPGLSLRGSWSQTVARPSFREMGFYASVELGTDDLTVGNPQLQLSDVQSWDTRVEYLWGEFGDLFAVSAFYKTIEKPIESILLQDPIDFGGPLWRTFFNNPNKATLWGIELEARKYFDFAGLDVVRYLSIGGNFTYISAEVDRTEAEQQRAEVFFKTVEGEDPLYSGLAGSRRLFNQPEWIANADITFDHPEWGTKATLAFFAISDVLDAAGSGSLKNNGFTEAAFFDRYRDSFHQLDLILSQTWSPGFIRGQLSFKFTAKNLTDSTRRLIYDPNQTADKIAERSYKKGREFSFSVSYSF
jgi:outer membrane receptor protein involved in Fe transport